jgi:hypothetical protein
VWSDPSIDDAGLTRDTRAGLDGFDLVAEESAGIGTHGERTDTGTTGGNAPGFGAIAAAVALDVGLTACP